MEAWQLTLCGIAALVAAALIPLLLQARRTLRALEDLAVSTRPRLERALDEVSAATARLNRAAETVERQAEAVRPLVEGIADIGRSFRQARFIAGAVTAIGAALGPTLAAALGGFFARPETKEGAPPEAEPTPLRRPARTSGES